MSRRSPRCSGERRSYSERLYYPCRATPCRATLRAGRHLAPAHIALGPLHSMLNEQLDKQKEQLVREAGSALRQQEQALEQLSSSAVGSLRRPPVAAPSTTAQRPTAEMAASVPVEDSAPSGPGRGDSNNGGGAFVSERMDFAPRWASSSSSDYATAAAHDAAEADPRGGAFDGRIEAGGGIDMNAELAEMEAEEEPPHAEVEVEPAAAEVEAEAAYMGIEAELRYVKAQLAVTGEEVLRLRSQLAAKASELTEAAATVKEQKQELAKQSKAEKAGKAALEREKVTVAEQRVRIEALERELALTKKEAEETARTSKASSTEQRAKDVRLNRALEELEKYRSQLRELREDRDGAGQGARAEAARLAAENNRLKKRQSELLLAFKKQVSAALLPSPSHSFPPDRHCLPHPFPPPLPAPLLDSHSQPPCHEQPHPRNTPTRTTPTPRPNTTHHRSPPYCTHTPIPTPRNTHPQPHPHPQSPSTAHPPPRLPALPSHPR